MTKPFEGLLEAAHEFEKAIIDRLQKKGWLAFPFGQSQLPEECRDHLRRFEDSARRPALIRWMPDILASRDLPNGRSYVVLIDAKICSEERENYAIQLSAIEAAEVYADRLYTPTFFVFNTSIDRGLFKKTSWSVLSPREARQRGRLGPDKNAGSGTAYVLVDKRFGRPFVEIFPAVEVANGEQKSSKENGNGAK